MIFSIPSCTANREQVTLAGKASECSDRRKAKSSGCSSAKNILQLKVQGLGLKLHALIITILGNNHHANAYS